MQSVESIAWDLRSEKQHVCCLRCHDVAAFSMSLFCASTGPNGPKALEYLGPVSRLTLTGRSATGLTARLQLTAGQHLSE